MSVFKCTDRDGYRWEFMRRGVTYRGHESTKKEAQDAEDEKKAEVRAAEQITAKPVSDGVTCPTISEWAGIFLQDEIKRITKNPNYSERKRAQKIKDRMQLLTVVLRYFGTRPEKEAVDRRPNRNTTTKDLRPYHNLTLDQPIKDPKWIVGFEEHLDQRGLANQSKNNQRNILSVLYAHALQPKYMQRSGITMNPFRNLAKDPGRRRTRTLTTDEFVRIHAAAARHLQYALDIGLYAYALRIGEILRLTVDDLDTELTTITILDHKGNNEDVRPKTVPVSDELREVLQAILADPTRNPKSRYLIQFPARGRKGMKDRIESCRNALRGACDRAGVVYGSQGTGVTFHTIRHTMGTEAARMGIAFEQRKKMIGHKSDAATAWYDHANTMPHRESTEALNADVAARRAKWEAKVEGQKPGSPHKVLTNSSQTLKPRLIVVRRK